MKFFLTYWSPIIATIAFLLSLWSAYQSYTLTHLKPQAFVKWVNEVKDSSTNSKQVNMCISIFNGSSKPISVNHLWLNPGHKAVEFPLVLISGKTSKIYTDELPINIEPFKSHNIVVAFQYVGLGQPLDSFMTVKLIYDFDKELLINSNPSLIKIGSQAMLQRLDAYRVKN